MIKNISTENGVVEIEEIKGTVVDVAADLACIVEAIFTAMTEDDVDSKELVGAILLKAAKMPFQDEANNQKNQEKKSDDPTDAAFMAFLSMLMSDDKRPVS